MTDLQLPTTDVKSVYLLPKRAKPFFARHPWVYPGAIAKVEGEPADGDVVDLASHAGNFVARGLYNSRSKLRVRLYSWSAEELLDADFFRRRFEAAIRLRGSILGLDRPGQACRLVFSEADGLSGCIVDRYDRWLVLQITSLGLGMRRDLLADILMDLVKPEGIVLRTERGIRQLEGLELQDGLLRGTMPSEPIVIDENGVKFLVNLVEGQKTGFYLDQRDNRLAVARLSAGRRVLDAFTYTGGFALHAAKAGAKSVLGMDVSQAAIDMARTNADRNGLSQVEFECESVFERLDALVQEGRRFDLVVLDPPKFARARNAVEEALRGYRRLQTLALRLLDPDGILVVCCCSGLIGAEMLEEVLAQTAVGEHRTVQILECRGAAPDHPVSTACPESNYLKCLIARVE